MQKPIYEPIKLSRTNRYPGYQFHANIRIAEMDDFSAFRYIILTVFDWMLKRIPPEDRNAPELQMPAPEQCVDTAPEAFRPYHFSIGYALDITPLLYEGIWAMRLKEPDVGTDERQAVAGRFFTTRIGVRLDEKGFTELGILIDVTDPANLEKEIDFAFRPAFVRSLAIQGTVSFEHVRELPYGKPAEINSEDDYKRLLYMLDNEDNQMPLVVFTHTRPAEKKAASVPNMSMEDFIRDMKADPMMRFSSIRMTEEAKKFGSDQQEPQEQPTVPFDAEKFSKSAFGYARTYVLGDKYKDRFETRIRKKFTAGDILLCGARKFRGGVSVYRDYDAAKLAAQSYSKHKSPYSFGKTVFEAEARKIEQLRRTREIIESSRYEDKEKMDQLTYEINLLFDAIDNKDEDIRRLNEQANENYYRGMAFAEKEYNELEKENAELRQKLDEKTEQISLMQSSYGQAKTILDMMEPLRKTETLPVTNGDVIGYFNRMFADRIGFTSRGASSAAKCGISAANLWEILYGIANGLTDLFREKQENLTEDDVMAATGFEMSFREGSKTREQADFMRLREDQYDGKEISVEPHIKLKAGKGIPGHQRLHFCYLRDQRKIVIGYVGDHLESAASQYVSKR